MHGASEEPHGDIGSVVVVDRLPSLQSEHSDRGGPEAFI